MSTRCFLIGGGGDHNIIHPSFSPHPIRERLIFISVSTSHSLIGQGGDFDVPILPLPLAQSENALYLLKKKIAMLLRLCCPTSTFWFLRSLSLALEDWEEANEA